MRTVNIHHAKTHLSRLVEQAARGEPFVIARAGKPMVKVVPLDEAELAQPFIGAANTSPFDVLYATERIPDRLAQP